MTKSIEKTPYIIGKTGDWEMVIGLEIHAQVLSNSKLFSGASTEFGKDPNQNVSLIDAAMPGMLPVINKVCIEKAIKSGIALNAKINKFSVFDRKNYFYADLPQGYQISQYKDPIVGEGSLKINNSNGEDKIIGIERIHLEQDAGKSLHDQHPSKSFIDLNRTGVALMEIVSKPDLRSPEEAAAYVKKIRTVLRYIETCDGNMEEGSLRADCNVSVRKPNAELGTRCEIKNLNSIKFISQAIQYEAERQVEILENGGTIDQETRLFDTSTGETRSMRSKEDAHDYRYFPDPDLLPLELKDDLINKIQNDLPELPDQLVERLITEYGITKYDANVIVEEKEYVKYYENAVKNRDGKLVVNWMTSELFGLLKKNNFEFSANPISPEHLNQLVELIEDKTISGKIAKDVFGIMFDTSKSPKAIVKEQGLEQVTDDNAIEVFVDEVINNNKDKVEEYLSGKEKLFGFFVGQVMKISQGKANPGLVNQILKSKLK
ncbi:MAG: Asp-tRNA(Asn)/Glu-tRNA(Gln) amidotransferase GatCAB subunit B [SAR116 cluster bacterium]|nr:Asp-tRNA(Asn)/Glu-tRNA(Gln) amidotransferase GatCAB subunit B [SAR116 cluster bacterium]RPH09213.1 MAG: Asp-tRNA(Asn)/Glu-tRNA(Gln) amidotransferase subunit GatB [Alphaproteobacteria bacterium TMED54]|tara:strand:- start:696 stop:2165 length:1470 start_codon:yes stop_codon:yes gene_type:complete